MLWIETSAGVIVNLRISQFVDWLSTNKLSANWIQFECWSFGHAGPVRLFLSTIEEGKRSLISIGDGFEDFNQHEERFGKTLNGRGATCLYMEYIKDSTVYAKYYFLHKKPSLINFQQKYDKIGHHCGPNFTLIPPFFYFWKNHRVEEKKLHNISKSQLGFSHYNVMAARAMKKFANFLPKK